MFKKIMISVLIGLFVVALLPQMTQAQFGKQLIDYEKHNWKYVETEHFRLFFYEPWVEAKLPQLVSWTEGAYRYLAGKLDYYPLFATIKVPIKIKDITVELEYWHPTVLKAKDKISIFFYANEADFWRTKTTFYPPIGAGAFAEQLHWRIVMPIIQDSKMMVRLITHELAHIFQFACWYKGRLDLIQAILRTEDVVWYFEGYSQHLSGLHLVRPSDIYLTRLVALKDFFQAVKTWEKFSNYLINYNLAPHFFDFIAEKYGGQETIGRIFKEIGIVGPTDKALRSIIHRVLRKGFGQIDLEFRDYLRNKYKHLYLKNEAHKYGVNLHLVEEIQARRFTVLMSNYEYIAVPLQPKKNIRKVKFLYEPAVSPDGKTVAGWTEWKGKFTLVLADAIDLAFIKNLTPGYSLRKYGVWPEFNPYFGEGRGLSWSRSNPDKLLYIAETLEKHPALIIIDPDTKKRQKISLPFDEPNSPEMDGQKVVFSAMKNGQSDLFLFNLETKEFENLTNDQNFDFAPSFSPDQEAIVYVKEKHGTRKLFLLNLKTSENRQITFGSSNEIRPIFLNQKKILFLSDLGSDRIYNIYTLNLETGKTLQLTDLIYGVVSVLPKPNSKDNQILFSAPDYRDWLHDHEFNLYQANLTALEPAEVEFDYSSVSPSQIVLEEPRKLTSEVKKYKPEFHVQKKGMLGFDSWYGAHGKGFFWLYDQTGEHQFVLDFTAYGKWYQTINAGYYNLRSKNDWGINFSREKRQLYPWWIFGGLEEPAIDELFEYLWTNQNSLALWKIYPLNLCNRLEFGLSAHSVKFDYYGWLPDAVRAEFLEKYFQSGQFLKGSFSLVRDTVSYSSQTGQPMAGSASRLNLDYSTGNFQKSAIFEVRKYFRLSNQSTIAWRGFAGFQSGRAISPFIIGDFGELRGYRVAQFTGNYLLLTNLELRIPLIHEIRTGLFRAQNVRGAVFVDLGRVEWSEKKFNALNYDDFSSQPWRGGLGLDIDLGSITFPFLGIQNLHFVVAKKFALPKWKLQKEWSYRFYFGYSF